MRRSRPVVPATSLLATGATALVLLLAGCGQMTQADTTGGGATTTRTISVTIEGDSVTPNGERVDVAVGQPIELEVTADAPGTIHVHSEPEQELAYEAGTTTLDVAPLEMPGVVDVESHELEKTIVQLEVR